MPGFTYILYSYNSVIWNEISSRECTTDTGMATIPNLNKRLKHWSNFQIKLSHAIQFKEHCKAIILLFLELQSFFGRPGPGSQKHKFKRRKIKVSQLFLPQKTLDSDEYTFLVQTLLTCIDLLYTATF